MIPEFHNSGCDKFRRKRYHVIIHRIPASGEAEGGINEVLSLADDTSTQRDQRTFSTQRLSISTVGNKCLPQFRNG